MKKPSLRWYYFLAGVVLAYMVAFKVFGDRLSPEAYYASGWVAVALGLAFLSASIRVQWQEQQRQYDFERGVKRMGAAILFLNTGTVSEEFGIRDDKYALYVLQRSKEIIPGLDITFFEEQVRARLSTVQLA